MATFHDVADEKDKNNRYLARTASGLFIALMMALLGWYRASQDITVHQPPDPQVYMASKVGYVPEETIYAFVPLILQQLFLWENSGDTDYEDNRLRLRQFLTMRYQQTLLDEIAAGKQKGTMQGLQRKLLVLPSSIYSDASVEVVGDHWRVWLDVEITDYIKDMVVNRGIHRLAVRVVRYDVHREANPWQLALDAIEQDQPLVTEKEAKNSG